VGTLWGANIHAAFIMVELRCSPVEAQQAIDIEPTADELLEPGGNLSQQRAHEIYNEFDFTDSAAESDVVTLSYGERVSISTHHSSSNRLYEKPSSGRSATTPF
jgi:hypothetical protein